MRRKLQRRWRKYCGKTTFVESAQWKGYTLMPTARGCVSAISHQSIMIVMDDIKYGHVLNTTV